MKCTKFWNRPSNLGYNKKLDLSQCVTISIHNVDCKIVQTAHVRAKNRRKGSPIQIDCLNPYKSMLPASSAIETEGKLHMEAQFSSPTKDKQESI